MSSNNEVHNIRIDVTKSMGDGLKKILKRDGYIDIMGMRMINISEDEGEIILENANEITTGSFSEVAKEYQKINRDTTTEKSISESKPVVEAPAPQRVDYDDDETVDDGSGGSVSDIYNNIGRVKKGTRFYSNFLQNVCVVEFYISDRHWWFSVESSGKVMKAGSRFSYFEQNGMVLGGKSRE